MAEFQVTSGYDGIHLPYSPEAEQSVLGAVLLDSSCLERVAAILPGAEYFHLGNHKMIYSAMLQLSLGGRPVDFVTILETLKGNEQFDGTSGKTYMLQLAQIVPTVANVEGYAKIVRDKYDVRSLILACREIMEDAGTGAADPEGLLDLAEQRIFDIRQGKNIQGLERINEVLVRTFDRLDMLNSDQADMYKGVPTGITELDKTITGLNPSDLILLAARPGVGKTSFALNIARDAAVRSKKTVAFFSFEMTNEQLVSRLLASEANIHGTKLRTGALEPSEWVRLTEATDILAKAPLYFDDNSSLSVHEMKAKLRRLKKQSGLGLVVIDYLQLMSTGKNMNNRVLEISEITRNLKIMAKELMVPVVTLSQLSRASEQRADHRPQLSDLRDSGSIEQDADIVLFLFRENYYENKSAPEPTTDANSAKCIVAKNRHGETRDVDLHWQGEFMRFTSQELIRREN